MNTFMILLCLYIFRTLRNVTWPTAGTFLQFCYYKCGPCCREWCSAMVMVGCLRTSVEDYVSRQKVDAPIGRGAGLFLGI